MTFESNVAVRGASCDTRDSLKMCSVLSIVKSSLETFRRLILRLFVQHVCGVSFYNSWSSLQGLIVAHREGYQFIGQQDQMYIMREF